MDDEKTLPGTISEEENRKAFREQIKSSDLFEFDKDHIKAHEEFIKSMNEQRDNELIDKLIARMKDEGFVKIHDPDYIRKAIDSLYPPGFVDNQKEPEPCPDGIYGELHALNGKTTIKGPFNGDGSPIEIDEKIHKDFLQKAEELISNLQPIQLKFSNIVFKVEPTEILNKKATEKFIADAKFKQSNIDDKDYKYGGMGEVPRMTQEQREKLLPGDRNYYDEFIVLQDAKMRAARIRLKLDKSHWCCFKEFAVREWKAAKELWKRWVGR